MTADTIQAVRGMGDILPPHSELWQQVEQTMREVTRHYGYREIRPPLIEHTDLFKRSIGEHTDIVEKEMYSFADRGDDHLTLRPEATASCMRAGIQHGLFYNRRERLWYLGPMFRRERPQKGRYRQFHQFGIEAVGWPGPDLDAEVLLLGARLFSALGVDDLRLEINTLGGSGGGTRAVYRRALVAYCKKNMDALDEDSRRRLAGNPLRILDSKNPAMRELLAAAPKLPDYLEQADRDFFHRLCALLDAAGVAYTVNPHLVRGLDYYTSTVFEFTTADGGAQNAVCAGGRYDNLVKSLGGHPTPAVGFALGLERLLACIVERGAAPPADATDAYLAVLDAESMGTALVAAERLRDAGIAVCLHCGGGAVKNQLRQADRSGARYALILGADEVASGTMTMKPLRGEAPQQRLPLSEIIALMQRDETNS